MGPGSGPAGRRCVQEDNAGMIPTRSTLHGVVALLQIANIAPVLAKTSAKCTLLARSRYLCEITKAVPIAEVPLAVELPTKTIACIDARRSGQALRCRVRKLLRGQIAGNSGGPPVSRRGGAAFESQFSDWAPTWAAHVSTAKITVTPACRCTSQLLHLVHIGNPFKVKNRLGCLPW